MSKWISRLLAILIGGGLIYMVGSKVYELKQGDATPKTAKKKGGARTVSVDLASAEIGQVRETLVLTGALKPKEMVDVTPKAAGRLTKTYFRIGDQVKQGDLVAELEDSELQQRVRRAEAAIAVNAASVSQRDAELSNVRANLQRSQQLFEEGLLSPQEFEQQKTSQAMIEAQVELARAQKEQSEAELRELKIQLAQMKIYAPLGGIVALRYVDEGAVVSPTSPIVRIVNLSTLVTQGNVPERSIGKLRVGNVAEVRVDAIPDEVFHGRISRISPVLDAATRSALIEIDIQNPANVLKAEMFARINLDLGTTRQATLIPRDGLVYRGQQPGVYVLEDENKPVFRPIETGMTRENQVEVLANLDPGTKIVGRGATMLRDGDRIAVAGAGGGGGAASKKGGSSDNGAEAEAPAQGAGKKGAAKKAAT
ncbi:MAG: efflux RND transporter periplasmic adaptor subunit [Acidobacteria bacterium]|nr:efflux RND transporter periplasmic adaptor subunit [Acidobacteriota bacterium]